MKEEVATEKKRIKEKKEKRREMMMKAKRFFTSKQTKAIEFYGETVEVRPLDFRGRSFIEDLSMTYDTDKGIQVLSGTIKLLRLQRQIKSWSFKDENGNPVPVNEETINTLDPEVADELFEKLEEAFDEELSEEDKKEIEGN